MSLQYLLQQYDAIGIYEPLMPIRIDQNFTGSAQLADMFREVLGIDDALVLTCRSWTRVPDATGTGERSGGTATAGQAAGPFLALIGTATLLGIESAAVTFRASERQGDLLVVLEITLPQGWKFSSSFPDLPGYYDPLESDEEQRYKPTFLDTLSLGASKLVFTNQAHYNETYQTDLLMGVSFVGELYFMGALFGVSTIVGHAGPIAIAGPVHEYRQVPDPMVFRGIRLQGAMTALFEKFPVSLHNPRLYIKSPLDFTMVDHQVSLLADPGIYCLAQTSLMGRPADLVSKYTFLDNQLILSLYCIMTDFRLAGFSLLAQDLGGDDITGNLPTELQQASSLQLTTFGISANLTDVVVDGLMVGVSYDTAWVLIEDMLTVDEVGVSVIIAAPFSAGERTLHYTVSGTILLGETARLVVFAEFPDYRFGGGLPEGETLPIGVLINKFFPQAKGVPELVINDLILDCSPKTKEFSMFCNISEVCSIAVGATELAVESLALAIDYAPGTMTGAFTATMTIAEATVLLSGELTDTLTLAGSLQQFDLQKFWTLVTGGEALPAEIPNIIFETLTVSVSPGSGDFSVLGNTTIAWDNLAEGGSLTTNVQFAFSHTAIGSAGTTTSAINARLSLQGTGPAEIASGFTLNTCNFLFEYQTGSGWKLSGGMNVDLFDTGLYLQAGYETGQIGQKIKLQAIATSATQLIALAGVGSYSFTQFDLLLDRRATEGGKQQTFFDLRLASTLEFDHVCKIGGYLHISNTAEGTSALLFNPDHDCGAFTLDFPTGEGVGMQVEIFEIGFIKESDSVGWAFTGTTYVGFTGLSSGWSAALPSRVFARLVTGANDARIVALSITDPIEIPLPTIDGKTLGKAVVQLTELGISLKPELGLVLEAGVGLPAELNAFLGGGQIFRVYQPGNVLSMARTRFTISGTGVAIQFLSSPFAGANAVVIEGESWFDVDFGPYGAISLKLPTFVYDGVTQYFEAGGGCKVTRPLALPLQPLTSFLSACGLQDFANMFPDKIPVEGLVLVDKDNNLKIDEFVDFLKQVGDVPHEVIKVLRDTAQVLNRFPDGFKHYFNLEAPEQLEFKFGFSPTGRVSLALLAPAQPIRVLFPSVVQSYVPMPGLTGIELRQLTVGTIMSGSLFFAEVDAVIDQFDVPSLVVSLMLPRDEDFPLPTSDQLQRRIILDNVFCIIPVSAGLPVPIPVFYDQIGLEYLGVEGVGMQAHMSFPKPALDGSSAVAFFTTLKDFVSNNKTLLDPKNPPGGLDLVFTFRDEYLQAPEYLGGRVLGTRGKDVKIGAWKYVANLMNFCKRFSINDFVGSIPYEYRVGSAEYRFAFMTFDADWLLTTPAEFRNGAFEQLQLTASDRDDFMDVLPAVATTAGQQVHGREEGLVVFVRGQADLTFVRLEAVFGLAASGSMGFNTGFKLDGTIGQVIDLELSGAVMVNAPLAQGGPTIAPVPAASAVESAAATGQALSLNGRNAWVEIPAADSLVLSEYTIELWVRPDANQTGEWVEVFGVDTLQGGNQRNYYLEINTKGTFYHHRFKDSNSGNSGAPNTPNGSVHWGTWQHVTLTNDGVTARTFIDGKEAASGPVHGALTLFKQPIFIGKIPGSGSSKFFKGDIAEIRIWKRARTAAEVEAQRRDVLQGDEKDLVSLYRFSADTGSKAVDVCGRNHGKITNGLRIDSGLLMLDGLNLNGSSNYIEQEPEKLRHDGLIFSGQGDYAYIGKSDKFASRQYTIEVWIRPDKEQLNSWQCIWGGNGKTAQLYLHSNGIVSHRFVSRIRVPQVPTNVMKTPFAPSVAPSFKDVESTNACNTDPGQIRWGEWNHLALTNDGQTYRTFVNGVVKNQGKVNGTLVSEPVAVNIGRSDQGKEHAYFRGSIDDIRIWSVARTEEQIATNMSLPLTGREPGVVAYYNMDHTSGTELIDLGPSKLNGTVNGAAWALAVAPADVQRAAMQIQGHTHLTVAGHKVMVGDLRVVNAEFWFSGEIDLFPPDWPIRVYGHVEGMVSKKRFYLSGETQNKLFGLVLSKSRLYISNEQMRLEGRWLGAYALLDISWQNNDPIFAGSMEFDASPTLDFGVVRVARVKVADNVRITLALRVDVAVVISKRGFAADVNARFAINSQGFSLSFSIDIAPSDLADLINWVKQRIIDAPGKYLEHLFSDAEIWLQNVGSGAIEFAKDAGEAVGAALKAGFGVTKEALADVMQEAGYTANQVGAALSTAYHATAQEVTNLLKAADYAVEDIGKFLKDFYKDSDEVVSKRLKDAGYAADAVGKALQSAFQSSAEDTARLLKLAGYSTREVGDALQHTFGKGAADCMKILKSAGFNPKDVDDTFKDVGKAVTKGVESVGKAVEKTAKKAGKMFKKIF